MTERIISAAIHQGGLILSLPSPARHHTIMKDCVFNLGLTAPINGTQGFLTSAGRFVNRIEALHLAKIAGQMSYLHEAKELYSEDLW
jgi:hypothetical protein